VRGGREGREGGRGGRGIAVPYRHTRRLILFSVASLTSVVCGVIVRHEELFDEYVPALLVDKSHPFAECSVVE
jgi:hypothetical protein